VARVLIKSSARVLNTKSYRKGFSLIEVLVALAILGSVLLVSLSFIIYQLKKEKENTEMIQAIEIAKSKMEEVLSLTEVKDNEEIVNGKFLLKIKVLDGDKPDEPINLRPMEIQITVYKLKEKTSLIELYSLK